MIGFASISPQILQILDSTDPKEMPILPSGALTMALISAAPHLEHLIKCDHMLLTVMCVSYLRHIPNISTDRRLIINNPHSKHYIAMATPKNPADQPFPLIATPTSQLRNGEDVCIL